MKEKKDLWEANLEQVVREEGLKWDQNDKEETVM